MTTLKSRRETDRLRQKRWKDHQKALGKKMVSGMISLKAQLILNREKKRTGESNSAILERAILNLSKESQKE